MKQALVALAAAAALAVPAAASAGDGNAWGANAGQCATEKLALPNLGQAIQAGKTAHPDAKITPQAIAQSVHCAS